MILIRTPRGERRLELEEFEAEVRAGRIRPSTPVRVAVLTGERWVSARDLEIFDRLYVPARIRFREAFSLGRFPYLTFALAVVQVVVFVVLSGGSRVLSLDALVQAGAKVHASILELGETWRLFVANLLHRDLLHLGFNTFFLFNVGGTVENAYRGRDFVLILAVSALGTTVTSLAMSTVPSVGASGIVLGLFGSASVFGYKYGDLLPSRYRRYFGGAVLPYALFILYVGLASRDTDNWGHVGGLLAGAAVTVPLTPRLLLAAPESRRARFGAPVAVFGLVVAVLGLGPLIRALGPKLEWFEDLESGISLARPIRWETGENHLGDPAWGNRLGVSLGLRVERKEEEPFRIEALRESFVLELRELERSGEITGVRLALEKPFFIEGGRGIELEVHLESRAGPQRTRSFLIERGYHAYRVVMSAPEAWADAYAPVLDRLVQEIQLVETSELRRARRVAETFPGMSSAQVELAGRLAAVGEVEAAASAYQRALASVPDLPEALYGLARLSLAYGGDLEAAERAASHLWAKRPDLVPLVTLVADLRFRLGRLDEACRALQTALDRLEAPPEGIRARLAGLRCWGGAWMDQ